jgi:hypothetical protein
MHKGYWTMHRQWVVSDDRPEHAFYLNHEPQLSRQQIGESHRLADR